MSESLLSNARFTNCLIMKVDIDHSKVSYEQLYKPCSVPGLAMDKTEGRQNDDGKIFISYKILKNHR